MIERPDPNTIYLGGGHGPGGEHGGVIVNDKATSAIVTPGMLVETHNSSGAARWRPHAASAGTFPQRAFALDEPYMNRGVDDNYAAGDLCQVLIALPGSVIWAIVPSGQNIDADDKLESNGDGKLKAGTTYPIAKALDSTGGAVLVDTRVRAEVL